MVMPEISILAAYNSKHVGVEGSGYLWPSHEDEDEDEVIVTLRGKC